MIVESDKQQLNTEGHEMIVEIRNCLTQIAAIHL
jgi:hypothetical protein